MHTKKISSCQKKDLNGPPNVCVQHACFKRGLRSETFLFKDFKEHTHVRQHEPDQNLLKTKKRTLVKRYDKKKNKTKNFGQLRVCLFFLFFFCLCSYKQTKQESKCK